MFEKFGDIIDKANELEANSAEIQQGIQKIRGSGWNVGIDQDIRPTVKILWESYQETLGELAMLRNTLVPIVPVTPLSVTSVDSLNDITVPVNTTLAVATSLLPKVVEVTLSDLTTATKSISNWTSVTYDALLDGTYLFTGTIADTSIKATIHVEVVTVTP